MGDLAPLLTGGGPAGVILIVLIVALRWWANDRAQAAKDRTQFEENVRAAERRADEADARRELAEKALDAERAERRRIEDKLSAQIRELEGKVDHLSREIAWLRAQLGGSP